MKNIASILVRTKNVKNIIKTLEENPVFAQDFNLFLLRMKKGSFPEALM